MKTHKTHTTQLPKEKLAEYQANYFKGMGLLTAGFLCICIISLALCRISSK